MKKETIKELIAIFGKKITEEEIKELEKAEKIALKEIKEAREWERVKRERTI